MVRGSSNTSSQMTVMNLPVDVEPKTCGQPVRRLRPVRPPMLPESRKFRDLPGWDGLIPSTGGGSRTHTGVSAQRILSPQRLPFRHAGSCWRSIDRQEMPQKERAGPARPVRDRRWSDSQSIGPERWNPNPRPARTSPRRTCTGVRALRRPRPRDPARRRCPCSDRAARPAFPDTCRPAVGRGKPPESCLGGWRSRIPGCPTRRRVAA